MRMNVNATQGPTNYETKVSEDSDKEKKKYTGLKMSDQLL